MKSYFNVKNKTKHSFKQLSVEAQKAIAGRWFIELGYFCGGEILFEEISLLLPESIEEDNYMQELSEQNWLEILMLISKYYDDKVNLFTYFEAPVEMVKNILLNNLKELENYKCWNDYSKDYGKVFNYGKDKRLPCLSRIGDENIFEDGWHRLHSYINQGHLTIPIIEY